MDDRLNRIESKLDKISDRIGSVDSTLAAQHQSLREHMRRTALLERQVKPIEKHVAMVQGALKLIGVLALVGGIAEGVAAIANLLGKMH